MPKAEAKVTLHTAIVKGMKEDAAVCAKELLKDHDSLDVINHHIIPALDEVGAGFEANKIFLPYSTQNTKCMKQRRNIKSCKVLRHGPRLGDGATHSSPKI